MNTVRFRCNGNPFQMSYDIERDLYIIGSAGVNPATGLLEMSFTAHASRGFFVKYMLMRSTMLYRADDIEHGNLLLQTCIEIAMQTGEKLDTCFWPKVNEARTEALTRQASNDN